MLSCTRVNGGGKDVIGSGNEENNSSEVTVAAQAYRYMYNVLSAGILSTQKELD